MKREKLDVARYRYQAPVAEPSSVTFATGNWLTKRAAEQLAAAS